MIDHKLIVNFVQVSQVEYFLFRVDIGVLRTELEAVEVEPEGVVEVPRVDVLGQSDCRLLDRLVAASAVGATGFSVAGLEVAHCYSD